MYIDKYLKQFNFLKSERRINYQKHCKIHFVFIMSYEKVVMNKNQIFCNSKMKIYTDNIKQS